MGATEIVPESVESVVHEEQHETIPGVGRQLCHVANDSFPLENSALTQINLSHTMEQSHVADNALSDESNLSISESCSTDSSDTIIISNQLGIKNFPTNWIILRHQRFYYDMNPYLLLIPILTNDEVTNWDGHGYSAIVLAGSGGGRIMPANAYSDIGASYKVFENETLASQNELETARKLLEITILGLAKLYCITECTRSVVDTMRYGIPIPIAVQNVLTEMIINKTRVIRVRKIIFADHCQTNDVRHPAPDPRDLVLKAATNWRKHFGLYLVPTGGTVDNDEYEVEAYSVVMFDGIDPSFRHHH